jgi:hypothetical protein
MLDQVWWSGILGRAGSWGKATSAEVWSGEFLVLYQGARIHRDLFWSTEGVGVGALHLEHTSMEAKGTIGFFHNQNESILEGSGVVTYTEKSAGGRVSLQGMAKGRSLPFEVLSSGGAHFSRITYSLEPEISVFVGLHILSLSTLGEMVLEGKIGAVPTIDKRKLVHTLSLKGPFVEARIVVDQQLRDSQVWELKGRVQVDLETKVPGGILLSTFVLEQTDYLESQWYRGVTIGSYLGGPAMRLAQIRGEISFRSSPQPE